MNENIFTYFATQLRELDVPDRYKYQLVLDIEKRFNTMNFLQFELAIFGYIL
jgi:hypothetical protein